MQYSRGLSPVQSRLSPTSLQLSHNFKQHRCLNASCQLRTRPFLCLVQRVRLRRQVVEARVTFAGSPPELHQLDRTPRLAVFLSGGGSNFRSIYDAIKEGHINAEVAVRPTLQSAHCSPCGLFSHEAHVCY